MTKPKYRVAYFRGDARDAEGGNLTMQQIMALVQAGVPVSEYEDKPVLQLYLVPVDTDLTTLWGDDWDGAPANCNAGPPSELPPGSLVLTLGLGDPFVVEGKA